MYDKSWKEGYFEDYTLIEIVVMVDALTQTYLVCDSETLSTESVN